ncbi:MAG TPA: HlyD family type I secretion periplasmic adaptor subunit [Rhodocyclaceae bacterium]|nr:HlyD family type I secretion periplasmic adaptor subunit [Rhodocyclaceae bacterium]
MSAIYKWFSATYDRFIARTERMASYQEDDFEADADWAINEQTPRGARIAVWAAGIFLLVLIVWAALAQLDEVTRGEGKVIPSRQVQILQSLDGGIVEEILVKEGQQVKVGQLLLKIDPTRSVSSLNENRADYLSLQVKASRLRALAEGKAFEVPADVQTAAAAAVEQEHSLYLAKRSEMDTNIGIARQQLTQRSQELAEMKVRRDTAAQGLALTQSELDKTRPLFKTGAVSEVELLRLERDVARYKGDRDSAMASIPRIEAAMNEAQRKIQEVELNFRNLARTELSETMAKLSRVSEGTSGLADRVKQSEIRSQVNGTVKLLLVNTVGGVVQPGKEVVEIVPSDDALLLEARVSPRDIAFLHPGQPALVKFTAYDFSIYGGLDATLEHIGADTITDEKGNAFYVIRVRTLRTELGNQKLPIIPGMVAEVDILTGKKSILAYLLKPVLRAHEKAMTER